MVILLVLGIVVQIKSFRFWYYSSRTKWRCLFFYVPMSRSCLISWSSFFCVMFWHLRANLILCIDVALRYLKPVVKSVVLMRSANFYNPVNDHFTLQSQPKRCWQGRTSCLSQYLFQTFWVQLLRFQKLHALWVKNILDISCRDSPSPWLLFLCT